MGDGENESCKGSSHADQLSGSCPCTRPPTTSSPFLVILSPLALTACSAPKRSRHGAMRPVSRPDISQWATRRACARQRDNAAQSTAPPDDPCATALLSGLSHDPTAVRVPDAERYRADYGQLARPPRRAVGQLHRGTRNTEPEGPFCSVIFSVRRGLDRKSQKTSSGR